MPFTALSAFWGGLKPGGSLPRSFLSEAFFAAVQFSPACVYAHFVQAAKKGPEMLSDELHSMLCIAEEH